MKKSIFVLILVAVLVIIVSPGIIGGLAEKSVDENLDWAARESGELVLTSGTFERGWFSSEGQYRVELGKGQLRAAFVAASGDDADDVPVLLINTRLDHGLIPVSSMSREHGSLAPGLGSAVSTLSIEYDGGKIFEVPGTIYSTVGLTGDLDSRYVLEAGSKIVEDGEITWQPSTLNVLASVDKGQFEFDGNFGAMTFGDRQQLVSIDGATIRGKQKATQYGFNVGDLDFALGPMTVNASDMEVGGNKGIKVVASSSVEGGLTTANMHMEMNGQNIPQFGELSIVGDLKFSAVDAVALGALDRRIKENVDPVSPGQAMAAAENELKDLVAAGLNIDIERLDFVLPMGTLESRLSIAVPKKDRASFEWTSLLLSTEAAFNVSIPEALIQMATSMDPQMGAIVGLGYLAKQGDVYVMDAAFKDGLLTINGAPIPVPLGLFQ
ncbi:MAG TPA: DUF945 family protein [Woeseiaceae bacterium]|nr:DUF945 family protein [Woeseiaceae bacterium]